MKRLLVFFLLFLAASPVFSQEYFKWRYANDKPYTDDKGFHMMGSYVLCHTLDKRMALREACLLTLTLGALWEVKDGLIPCERLYYFGGDGFSLKDLTADWAGVVGYIMINYILFPKDKDKGLVLGPGYVQLRF